MPVRGYAAHMSTVYDVAARLIARQRSAERPIDKMQLQKLLYLVQGAHIALHGYPAFREEIRAYKRGPVVESVESTYRTAVSGAAPLDRWVGGDPAAISPEQAEAIDVVLERFGRFNGRTLENVTKVNGAPWHVARGDLPREAESREPIPVTLIAAWFVTHPLMPSDRAEELPAAVDSFDDVESFIASMQ
jgi:uncharacterized phage-associated protein